MAQSPEWWLERLANRLDMKRTQLSLLRLYLEQGGPLPEGAEKCRRAYRDFQKKSRTNFAELIVDSVTDRMKPAHFRVGDSNEDDDRARQLWVKNRLNIWSGDVHHDMLGLRSGYVCVQFDEDGEVEITYERPEQCITDHDPRRPDRVRAALKVYRDDVVGKDVAYVQVRGSKREKRFATVSRFERDTPISKDGIPTPIETVSGKWDFVGTADIVGMWSVTVAPFENKGCVAEFENHTDLLDRVNWTILQRLVITAMQAYRQRALKPTNGDLPEVDEDDNPIDYAALFEPGPGEMWLLPENVDVWESQAANLTDILESVKGDLRDLAAVTRTPLSALLPEGQNQSAEGASNAKEGAVGKAEDRIERARTRWADVIRLALAMEDGSEDNAPEVDVLFAPATNPSMSERYDALSKVGDAMPWRSKLTHILGFDGDVVDRMEVERAEEMLTAAAFAPPAEEAPNGDSTPGAPDNSGASGDGGQDS